jgi:hypothetical protein
VASSTLGQPPENGACVDLREAKASIRAGDLPSAQVALETCVVALPRAAEAWRHLGLVHFAQRHFDLDLSQESFVRARVLEPSLEGASATRDRPLDALTAACRETPGTVRVSANRAAVEPAAGRCSGALIETGVALFVPLADARRTREPNSSLDANGCFSVDLL